MKPSDRWGTFIDSSQEAIGKKGADELYQHACNFLEAIENKIHDNDYHAAARLAALAYIVVEMLNSLAFTNEHRKKFESHIKLAIDWPFVLPVIKGQRERVLSELFPEEPSESKKPESKLDKISRFPLGIWSGLRLSGKTSNWDDCFVQAAYTCFRYLFMAQRGYFIKSIDGALIAAPSPKITENVSSLPPISRKTVRLWHPIVRQVVYTIYGPNPHKDERFRRDATRNSPARTKEEVIKAIQQAFEGIVRHNHSPGNFS